MDINELRKISQDADNELAAKIRASVNVKGFVAELLRKLNTEAKTQAQKGKRNASVSLLIHETHSKTFSSGYTCREGDKGVLAQLLVGRNVPESREYAKAFTALVQNEISDDNIQLEVNGNTRTCEVLSSGHAIHIGKPCCTAWEIWIIATVSW